MPDWDFEVITATSTHYAGHDTKDSHNQIDLDRMTDRLSWRKYVRKESLPILVELCDCKITAEQCSSRVAKGPDELACFVHGVPPPNCPKWKLGGTLSVEHVYQCKPGTAKF